MDNHEILIRKAELKATGADIHDVRGMIGIYNRSVIALKKNSNELDKRIKAKAFYFSTIILCQYVDGVSSIKQLKDKYIEENWYDNIIRDLVKENFTGDWNTDLNKLLELGLRRWDERELKTAKDEWDVLLRKVD